uniref:Uncharacterized protein n=1 Tax=Leersia perrieri TaxID=77586 RepID=A0A0D9VGE3_9ORYZ
MRVPPSAQELYINSDCYLSNHVDYPRFAEVGLDSEVPTLYECIIGDDEIRSKLLKVLTINGCPLIHCLSQSNILTSANGCNNSNRSGYLKKE